MVRVEDRVRPVSKRMSREDEDLQYILDTQRQRRHRRQQEQCKIIRQLTEQLQLQNERLRQSQQLRRNLEWRLDRMRDDKQRFMMAYRHLRYKMA